MAGGIINTGPKRFLLWENSNNSLADGAEINLSSANYDFLEVEFVRSSGTAGVTSPFIQRFNKGTNITLMGCNVDPTLSNCFIISRLLTRNSDIKFTAGLGQMIRWGGTSSTAAANSCIPKAIYGITY